MSIPQLSDRDKDILNSIFNPSLPLGEGIYDDDIIDTADKIEETTPEAKEIQELEVKAIAMAESGKIQESLDLFDEILQKNPDRASTYNNRAQVFRLQGNTEAGFADLTKAIHLSGGKGRTCCQALCQRGILYRKSGKDDLAKINFQQAAKLGSKFAKQQLVEMNPYAALCNQMLSQVMSKLN